MLPTGVNPDHYDVQLVGGQREEDLEPLAAIRAAAQWLVALAGDLMPNPAYSGGVGRAPQEP